jgi:glycosyltransferase involved in cell wall biosynthesis
VSALVPTYNGAAFIQRTLDSLAVQTWPHLEIVVGDDCSTDDTLAIVRTFADEHDNVTVVERTSNLGWLRNTNDLMGRARGELMFFAFHDDVVDPTYVEKLVSALEDHPDAVLAYSDLELFETNGTSGVRSFDGLAGRSSTLERGFAMAHRPDNWWVPNRGVFRTSAYGQVGGIHPNDAGEFTADWTWLLHLALLGPFVRVPEVLCHKYFKPASISQNWTVGSAQMEALKRAGRTEVWMSSIPWIQKAVLVTYMRDLPKVPRPIRRVARVISTKVLR